MVHSLCQNGADELEQIITQLEAKFGQYLYKLDWLNLGGGHYMTLKEYDQNKLINLVNYLKKKYQLKVIFEPGEAIVLNTGYLVTEVLDIIKNEKDIAIINSSASAHMPDVIEMPYRPTIIESGLPNQKKHSYSIGGQTCLSGDFIGDYSFDETLEVGDPVIFEDMAQYTIVKNTTFNGLNLPSIALLTEENEIQFIKKFGYCDFKSRL